MRTLVVEDEPGRVEVFRDMLGEFDLTAEVAEAIAWLGTQPYDRLYLDHDLGTDPVVGRDVATWLIAHPATQRELEIIVHSMNVVSAPKIVRELQAAGRTVVRTPFNVLVQAHNLGVGA